MGASLFSQRLCSRNEKDDYKAASKSLLSITILPTLTRIMVAFQLFSGIAFVLLLVPYPLQLRSGNAALICYTTWLLLYVLITFVNSSVWAKTDAIIAPVWGDICECTFLWLLP